MTEGNGAKPAFPKALRLSEKDNVAVVVANLKAGETVTVSGRAVALRSDIPLGHKIALKPIAPGEKIYRYGVPIGSATQAIKIGEHVHAHNIRSDYLVNLHKEIEHGKA
jgi:hypothetical protein